MAWEQRLRDQLETAQRGRERLIEQLGLPAISQQQLTSLVQADKTGLLAWMQRGGEGLAPAVHKYEREELERRLAENTVEAATAKAAIEALDAEIETLQQRASILARRRPSFISAVLIETAQPIADRYLSLIEETQAVLGQLLGLAAITGQVAWEAGLGRFVSGSADRTIKLDLPAFDLGAGRITSPGWSCPRIIVDEPMVKVAAQPWREASEALAGNARAKVITSKGPGR